MVDQLTDQMVELINRGGKGPQTPLQVEDDEFGSPFGDGDSSIFRKRV